MKHRYCPEHYDEFEQKCAVKSCNQKAPSAHRTCLTHRAIEVSHYAAGKGLFQLKERLSRQRERQVQMKANMTLASKEMVDRHELSDELEDDDEVEVTFVADDKTGRKKEEKASFGRLRTNKEVVATMSCGVMIGRGTFHGSEAPSGVIVRINSSSIP